MFKIADAIIQKPHMRHGPAREIYRQAVKTENKRQKFWKEQNASRRNHDSDAATAAERGNLGMVLDQ